MTRPSDEGRCDICGEPMPEGETMFRMHGYSGPCPKPPLQKQVVDTIESLRAERDALRQDCFNLTEKVIPNLREQRDALRALLREARAALPDMRHNELLRAKLDAALKDKS